MTCAALVSVPQSDVQGVRAVCERKVRALRRGTR